MKIQKTLFYCLLTAFLLAASFPTFNFSFLAWLGFIPLLSAVENKSKTQAFCLSYFCGFLFFIFILYWLIHVTLVGLIILCLYLAFYFAFFGYFFSGVRQRYSNFGIPVIIFLSCLWVILEYLRSHLLTGFPWTLLGYSQYQNIGLIQFVDITGSWGASFLVIFVNLCLYQVIKSFTHKKMKSASSIAIVLLLMFAAIYGYGSYSLNKYSKVKNHILKVSLIQGNILQEEKWLSSSRDMIKKSYLDLSLEAAKDLPDMIIWPETSYPEYILKEDRESILPMLNTEARIATPLLFGSVFQEDDNYFNSAILLDKTLTEPQIYKKIHLVPFGEYFPLRKIFFFLEPFVPIGDFSCGKEFTVLTVRNKKNNPVNFGVLICFEDTIAEFSRKFVQKGAEFLVNITNDAWFKKSSSPYQHMQASVFRAVENRVYVLRAANTGVSCVIDSCGRIVKRLGGVKGKDIFVKGSIASEVYEKEDRSPSFYVRFGDLFILLCIIYVLIFMIKIKR